MFKFGRGLLHRLNISRGLVICRFMAAVNQDRAPVKHIGAIDQGTSSTRFVVYDNKLNKVASHQIEIDVISTQSGWSEIEAEHLLDTVNQAVSNCLSENDFTIDCIGIANQRESVVVWDRETGVALSPVILWNDARSTSVCDKMSKELSQASLDKIRRITGLQLSTYFSAPKLKWMVDNIPSVRSAIQNKTAMIGTVDSFLLYKLIGRHITDITNASRTMLMDIQTCSWSDELCKIFGIEKECLPTIVSNGEIYGKIKSGSLAGVVVSGCVGDQQAALIGHRCLDRGQMKNTYGTGCFSLVNVGRQVFYSKCGLLSTVAYKWGPNGDTHYALEGSVGTAGTLLKWLKSMGIVHSIHEISESAEKIKEENTVYFVPAFNGLYAPYWDNDARGTIIGITNHTKKGHLCLAALEGIAMMNDDVISNMLKDMEAGSENIHALRVDGGVTNSDILCQIQANVLGIIVERPKDHEVTARGAALAACVGAGIWTPEDVRTHKDLRPEQAADVFKPQFSNTERDKKRQRWKEAVTRSMGWAKE